ncbi:winged helix-turn-helix transcriptional regulator [Streptomyces samsunensis]|uniref:Lrp/AsnC family transcriptional regulator n=1 Tax=Streptomyces malaysiensis TaxID=92644 RepID=UPI0015815D5D|nr:winged helix-turn-helix transcriptional regulator [Streptomyces samsunensis]NUH40159.1 winged helix-turn-helix transcriptional regulator [Streptomyces samsunensis]
MIAALVKDGRISIRALADQIHISRANAYSRIGRMVADGVISAFTARLNPQRFGLGTSAYVLLTIDQNAWRSVSWMARYAARSEAEGTIDRPRTRHAPAATENGRKPLCEACSRPSP